MKILTIFLISLVLSCIKGDTPDSNSDTSEEQERQKVVFVPPTVSESAFFALFFSSPADLTSVLVKSEAKKDGVEDNLAKYDGIWSVEVARTSAIENDYGLVLKSKAKHHAIAAKLKKAVDFSHEQLVVQYEVKFQNAMDCGGAYVKLLSDQPSGIDLRVFNDKTPYTIMFGPDKCGLDHKLHFIFRHKNPITGEFEEKHAKKPQESLERYFSDGKTHLYTLVVNADNKFEIYIDQNLVNYGNLLTDFEPPVNPPKEVEDPNDKKPDDWDDREKIVDPEASKPEDWDESQPEYVVDKDAVKPEDWLENEELLVEDPNSVKPADWDPEMDGEWSPPKVDNPKCSGISGCGPWSPPKIKNPLYKGKWTAPLLNNPNYKGPWKARRIANPNYFEDEQPYRSLTPIVAIGLELWSMTDDIVFDNFLITNNKKDADDFAAQTWSIKTAEERKADPRAQSVVDAIQEVTREKPWVWGIVALVIGLPIILIIAYCYMGRGDSSSRRYAMEAARRKKTDEPSPDIIRGSPSQSGDDVEDEEEEEEVSTGGSTAHKGLNDDAGADDNDDGQDVSPKAALESDSESETEKKQQSASEKSASSGEETTPDKRVKKRFSRKE